MDIGVVFASQKFAVSLRLDPLTAFRHGRTARPCNELE